MKEIYGFSIGNILSFYFHSLAVCIYKEIDFDFIKLFKNCQENLYDRWILYNKYNWTKYLPKYIKYNIKYRKFKIKPKIDILKEDADFMKCNILENIDNKNIYSHFSHSFNGSWTEIVELIQEISLNAINKFIIENNQNLPIYNKNEVTIHIRTGDVLSGYHTRYPLLKFKYYLDNIPKNTEKITILGKLDYNIKTNHTGKFANEQNDNKLFQNLKKYLEENLKIEVELGTKYFSDFIYMVYSPILIISPSSFAMWSGIISENILKLPNCTLFCANKTPLLKNKIIWNYINDYIVINHWVWKNRKNIETILKRLKK